MHDAAVRADFETFAREHWAALMSIGLAVSGSRVEAEDLVQTALASAWVRWRRIRREQALAYLRRSIVNANVSRWRRRSSSELVFATLPDDDADDADNTAERAVDDRAVLLPILRTLPAGQRAVLVLRYLCDLPDDEIAVTLGVSAATVRSRAARGLAALRAAPSVEGVRT